jgi:hypothetical protein
MIKLFFKNIIHLFIANLTRIIYCIQSLFCIYLISSIMNNYVNMIQLILVIVIIADSIYISMFNESKEHAW